VVLHFGSIGRGAHSRASPMGTYAPRPMWPRLPMSGRPRSGWRAGPVPVGDPGVDGLGDGVGRAVLWQVAQGGAGFVHRLQGCLPEVFEGRVSVLGIDAGGELVRRHELQLG